MIEPEAISQNRVLLSRAHSVLLADLIAFNNPYSSLLGNTSVSTIADLHNYIVCPFEESAYYHRTDPHPLVEFNSLDSAPNVITCYRFNSGLHDKKLDKLISYYESVSNIIRELEEGESRLSKRAYRIYNAGLYTQLKFSKDGLFIYIGRFALYRSEYNKLEIQRESKNAQILYTGKQLYYKRTSQESRDVRFRPLSPKYFISIIQAFHAYPEIGNLLISCINHALGPEPHYFRDQLFTWPYNSGKIVDFLKLPFTFQTLVECRDKLSLLRSLDGKISKFSGRLPFEKAATFLLANKRIKPEQYDYLLLAYQKHESLRSAPTPEDLLYEYYRLQCAETPDRFHNGSQIIWDYLKITKRRRRKVNLSIPSIARLNEEHIALAASLNVKKLKVHKDFRLIKIKSLELIKTGERLHREGNQQHHCVASYDQAINLGRCAIYSTQFNNLTYTIEIGRKVAKNGKPTFQLAQIAGVCNRKAPMSLYKEIKDQLQKINQQQKKDVAVVKVRAGSQHEMD